MKRGVEWLAIMPYKYQVLFLKRLSETESATPADAGDTHSISEYLNRDFNSFYSFINESFTWAKTPEGHAYWYTISDGFLDPD
jgi:hypothetical protein